MVTLDATDSVFYNGDSTYVNPFNDIVVTTTETTATLDSTYRGGTTSTLSYDDEREHVVISVEPVISDKIIDDFTKRLELIRKENELKITRKWLSTYYNKKPIFNSKLCFNLPIQPYQRIVRLKQPSQFIKIADKLKKRKHYAKKG